MADETPDRDLSRRYRALPQEEPGKELDAAILAAARRAAETRPAPLVPPTARRRWYFPLAAAAILVLAVAVTVQVERNQPEVDGLTAPPPTSIAKQAIPQPAAPSAPSPAPREKKRKENAPAAEPEAPASSEAAQAFKAEQAKPEAAADAAERRDTAAERQASGGVAASAPAPAASLAAPQMRALAKVESLEQMLERIAALRRQGRDEEADKALAEFRKRYPDFKISEEMLKKVERR